MAALLELNEDVIHRIINHLSPSDAVSLAQTSRYADLLTIPRRLSRVRLLTAKAVDTFCDFCLADRPVARPGPRHILELTANIEDVKDLAPLCTVLQLAVQLHLLSLHGLGTALTRCPMLQMKPLKKTTVSTLILRGRDSTLFPYGGLHELFVHPMSSITTLEVQWWNLSGGADSWTTLASLSESLRVFRAHSTYFKFIQGSSAHTVTEPPAGLVCGGVHTIHLSTLFAPWLHRLSHFFPSVRTFHWNSSPFGLKENSRTAAHWPLLDHLICICTIWPPLPPGTRVRRLDFRYNPPDVPTLSLRSIAPVVLCSSTAGALIRGDAPPLLADGCARLRYISHIESRTTWEEPSLDELLPRARMYADAFAGLPLLGLSLDLALNWEGGYGVMQKSDCDAALANAAILLVSRIRTLRFVCIRCGMTDYHRETNRDLEGWFETTAPEDEEVIVRRLPWWEGDAVEKKLLALTA